MKTKTNKISLIVLGSIISLFLFISIGNNIYGEDLNTEQETQIVEEAEINEPENNKEEIEKEEVIEESAANKDIKKEEKVERKVKKVDNLADHEMIVYDYAQLKSGIEGANNGKTTFYFGDNITAKLPGIKLPLTKNEVTISGTDPNTNTTYTLNEHRAAGIHDTIYLQTNTTGPKTYTLKDIKIAGQNYYGPITIEDAAKNVHVIYDNVDYTGPQIGHNRYGTLTFKNSTINIPTSGFGSASQEVAEVKNVVIEGNNSINHIPYGSFPVFAFPFENSSFTMSPDSNLDLTSNGVFNGGVITTFSFDMLTNSKFNYNSTINNGSTLITGANKQMNIDGGHLDIKSSGNGRAISWANDKSMFKLNNGSFKYLAKATITYKPIYLGKMDVSNSTIELESQDGRNSPFIETLYSQNIVNSSIDMKILGSKASGNSAGLKATGTTTFDNSFYKVQTAGRSGHEVLETENLKLTHSSIDINMDGAVYISGASRIINASTSLSLDNSKLKVDALESGIILYTPNFQMKNKSEVDLSTKTLLNGTYQGVHIKNELNIPENNSFKLNADDVVYTSAKLLEVDGSINVNDNATFHVASQAGDYPTLIYFAGNNRTFKLSNPKSVYLNAGGIKSAMINGASLVSLDYNVQQINSWNNLASKNQVQLLDDLPKYMFTKANDENILMQGTTSNAITKVTSSNQTSEDGPDLLINEFSFLVSRARTISLGKMNLDVAEITKGDTSISGKTDENAALRAKYISSNNEEVANGFSTNNGTFNIATKPIDIVDIDIMAVSNHLYRKNKETVMPSGDLTLVNVPVNIDFGNNKIPTKTLMIDKVTPWNIEINDDRFETSNWNLYAKVISPMKDKSNLRPDLNSDFVYVDDNNEKQYLKENKPLLVAQSINGKTNIKINWQSQKGLMLEVNPGTVYTDAQYEGEIQWILSPADE